MTYRISGIDPAPYRPLFGLADEELARRGAARMTVDSPTFPCRVSLTDRALGEKVLLVNHVSHDVANPYRASHAIFVTEWCDSPAEFVDEVPPVFRERILSLRGFDEDGMMAHAILTPAGDADAGIRQLFANPAIRTILTPAGDADAGIRQLFANPAIRTIHAHNATRGCFSAKIERN